jgi:fumarate reductase flavoprotein subunit
MSDQKKNLPRRDFMKRVAIGSGAVAAAALLPGCSGDGATTELPEKWDYEADFVSVGMGAGGMTGAIYAAKAGMSVIALEKGKSVYKSTSAVSAWEFVTGGTSSQKDQGIEDSQEQFMAYFKDNSPDYLQKFDMIERFLPVSVEIYEWLLGEGCEVLGIKSWPGMDQPRLHALGSAKPMAAMLNNCEDLGVEILYETPGKKLIVKDGRIVGVEAEYAGSPLYIKAHKGVLLANGGFEGNPDMLYAYHGYLASMRKPAGTTNNTGDGFTMAWSVGAATEDVWIGVPPAVSFLKAKGTAYGLYHAGGILVNQEGKRFVNESESHTNEANAIAVQTDGVGWVITDEKQRTDPVAITKWDLQADQGGEYFVADTIEELAELAGLPVDAVVETVKQYNDYAEANEDPDFGRDHILLANEKSPLEKIESGPFYCLGVMGANFPTEMGLVIDPDSRVFDVWENAIPGLYATGLMANIGIKYPPMPRTLTAVSGAMVFGATAAQHAATMENWDA